MAKKGGPRKGCNSFPSKRAAASMCFCIMEPTSGRFLQTACGRAICYIGVAMLARTFSNLGIVRILSLIQKPTKPTRGKPARNPETSYLAQCSTLEGPAQTQETLLACLKAYTACQQPARKPPIVQQYVPASFSSRLGDQDRKQATNCAKPHDIL